jgi:hypothetical protein
MRQTMRRKATIPRVDPSSGTTKIRIKTHSLLDRGKEGLVVIVWEYSGLLRKIIISWKQRDFLDLSEECLVVESLTGQLQTGYNIGSLLFQRTRPCRFGKDLGL